MRGRRGTRRSERGALTPAVAIMALGFLVLGGLVTDGGRQVNAKLTAQAVAEEAARAGATVIDPFEATAQLDRATAYESVGVYCAEASKDNPEIVSCDATGFGFDDNKQAAYVEVTVRIEVSALLFGLIGINTLDAEASAVASPVQGITNPSDDVLQPSFSVSVEYPTTTIAPPTTSGEATITPTVPTQYTTSVPPPCATVATLPLTVGITCSVTTTTNDPPPPPGSTRTLTSYTTYPTSVPPVYPSD